MISRARAWAYVCAGGGGRNILLIHGGRPVATCLLSVIDEQLRVSRVKFSYLLFNNASLFGRFHGWGDY